MKPKLYFTDEPLGELSDERCYPKKTILEEMKESGIKEMIVFEAKREIIPGYFFCKEYQEVEEIGESCGKICNSYIPNNGKNGRCKHYGWFYEATGEPIKLTTK